MCSGLERWSKRSCDKTVCSMSMNLRELIGDTHLKKTWKNWSDFIGTEIPTNDQISTTAGESSNGPRGGRDRENGPRGSRSAMASSYGGRTILSEVLMWTVSFGQTIDGPRGGRSVGENTADASRGGRSTAESSTIVKRETTTAGKEQTVVKERRRGTPWK